MRKLFAGILLALTVFSCSEKQNETNKRKSIAILQFVAHPALDRAKQGFVDYFSEKGVDVKITEKNANGEIGQANILASSFAKENVDLIYAIATPSAQASLNATNKIPIVYSAVTDPLNSGLTGENITGVSDFVNVEEQLKILKQIDSNIKKVGFLYNSSEKNSMIQLEETKKAAEVLGLQIEAKSVTQISEIPQAVKHLAVSTDAIYIPTDNLVASAMPVISSEAIKAKKIVLGSEKAHVEGGALITKGIDYYELGKKAGEMAYKILFENAKISDKDYAKMELNDIEINQETLKQLGITLPSDLK